ncbi:MAG: hypothetical protein SNG45_06660 [Rikenellaceae bacterium]
MKKILIYTYTLLVLLFLGGCESNAPSVDISDVAWVTSGWKQDGDYIYEIDEEDYLYFMNASQGALSTTWEISPECVFMIDDFNDSDDIASQAAPEKGLTSNNIVETVYFPTGGTHYVKFTTTFNEWVTSHDDSPTEAVYNDELGVWVYEHTLSVVVKEALAMGYQVIHLGDNKIYDESDEVIFERVAGKTNTKETEISIEDGDILRFISTSTGTDLVETVTWVVNGETFETAEPLDYTFNYEEGEENVYTDFSLMIERTERPATDITANIQMILTINPEPLDASFSITKADGAELTEDAAIDRGDKLYFNDLSAGTGYTTEWGYFFSEDNGVSYKAHNFTPDADGGYTFTTAGLYSMFVMNIENTELYAEGKTTSTASKQFTLTVDVPEFGISSVSLDIASTATHANTDTPTIEIAMNNTLAALPSFSSATGGFTLTVTDYAGATQTVNVTEVTADDTKLSLKLDAKIYQGDTVKLSYTQDQEIKDVDGAVIADFVDRVITITSDTDLYKDKTDYDFETGTTAGTNGWTGPSSISNTTIDTTTSVSGSNSILVSDDKYSNGFKGSAGSTTSASLFYSATSSVGVEIPAGNYLMQHYVKVGSSVLNASAYYTTKSKDYDVDGSSWVLDVDDSGSTVTYSYPSADGEWHLQQSVLTTSGGTGVKTSILIYSVQDSIDNFSAGMQIWFDKIKLIPIR